MGPESLQFYTLCRRNSISISNEQMALLERYVTALLRWNKQLNLVSRNDEENIWQKHILHSVSLLFKVDVPQQARMLDLGTGGGLPGIPIKILRPDLQVTLLDATRKKIGALQSIVEELQLTLGVVCGRAEDLSSDPSFKRQFELVVARAVAELKDLVSWSRPFLHASGRVLRLVESNEEVILPALIAYKGGNLQEELARLKRTKKIETVKIITLDASLELFEEKKLVIIPL
jgi:16S rRNA (guanine527-N7)-methyltransferase